MSRATYTALEASRKLSIHRKSLYAYVSRGLVRAYDGPGRSKRYDAADIDALLRKKQARAEPPQASKQAPDWHGEPTLASRISRLEDGALFYREHAVEEVVTGRLDASIEQIASLLWSADSSTPPQIDFSTSHTPLPPSLQALAHANALPSYLPALKRAQLYWSIAEHDDLLAYRLDHPSHVIATGERVVSLLLFACTHHAAGAAGSATVAPHTSLSPDPAAPAATRLASAWRMTSHSHLLDLALMLCAEHGLNASTFAARVAASARATPYGVCQAGLATLLGQHHAGTTLRIGVWLDEIFRARTPGEAIANRLRRGESWPGLGHPLYPAGDERAKILWQAIQRSLPDEAWARQDTLLQALHAFDDLGKPSLDLMLVLLTRILGGSDEDALTLFVVGRCVGWIAHALEQYQEPHTIPPCPLPSSPKTH